MSQSSPPEGAPTRDLDLNFILDMQLLADAIAASASAAWTGASEYARLRAADGAGRDTILAAWSQSSEHLLKQLGELEDRYRAFAGSIPVLTEVLKNAERAAQHRAPPSAP